MSTLSQMIYNIRNTPDGGRSHRASKFGDRQIALWIQATRNQLIYEEFARTRFINPLWEQDLGCVQLTDVDKADCYSYKWGTHVKKAVLPEALILPNMPYGNGIGITFIGLIDKRTRISTDVQGYGEYAGEVLYAPKPKHMALVTGNTVYIESQSEESFDILTENGLCVINVRQISAAPNDVCADWDNDKYPICAHLEELLYQRIFANELRLAVAPQDKTNDDNADDVV